MKKLIVVQDLFNTIFYETFPAAIKILEKAI